MEEKLCVIIPAYNEESVIRDCLNGLVAQTYSHFEAFIIDDLSTDNTKAIIQEFVQKDPQRFRLFEFGKVGPGKARNLAAYETNASILAFTDADCIPTAKWLEELVRCYADPGVGAAGGPHRAPPQSSFFQLEVERFLLRVSPLTEFIQTHPEAIVETRHNPLCNVSYRREIFIRLHGFREDLFPGEDVEIDSRVKSLGHRIVYNPMALVFHHRPESIQQFRKVMHAYGRSMGKLTREAGPKRLPQWIGILSVLGWAFLFWILVGKLRLEGLVSFLILFAFFFRFRPEISNQWGLWLNSLQWFNGFYEGFITRRSEPPGFNPLSLSERAAKLRKSKNQEK